MKKINRCLLTLGVVFFAICGSGTAKAAAGETAYNVISRLYMRNTGVKIYTQGSWNSPQSCQDNTVLVLPFSHAAFQPIFSALLAAKSSGQQVSAYVTGCFSWGDQTFPLIEGLYLR